jgi:hypothetical protein
MTAFAVVERNQTEWPPAGPVDALMKLVVMYEVEVTAEHLDMPSCLYCAECVIVDDDTPAPGTACAG